MQKNQYLIIEDIDGLGRSGEIVENIKPGFLRNYLLPKKKVLKAGPHTLRRQKELQEAREKQAKVDLEESMKLAEQLKKVTLSIEVEVNTEGEMYGSINILDILHLLEEKKLPIERRMIRLAAPIKKIGEHTVPLKLKEGYDASVLIQVNPKGGAVKEAKSSKPKATSTDEETSAE